MKSALATYLADLQDSRGPGVKETSYYPALANLLNTVGAKLKPKVKCVIHPKGKGAGIPDGGLFTVDQLRKDDKVDPLAENIKPARGVIEAKALSESIESMAATIQVKKYLNAYGSVLATNFREFALIVRGANGTPNIYERHALTADTNSFWKAAAQSNKTAEDDGGRFEDFLRRVMLHGAPITQPKDLAWLLASYAREARARVERAGGLPQLAQLRAAMEDSLGIQFEGDKGEHFFRSTLVQTLFYGVFSAWVLWHEQKHDANDPFDWRLSAFSLNVPVLRALFEQIAQPTKLKSLNLIELLNLTNRHYAK